MDIDMIMGWLITFCISFALVACPIIGGYNFHQKDLYRKELILNCNNDLACMKLILGDTKYGY